ncbi:hypothetical protein [Novosphingobium sp.]|uniref:hypothetical protein n=1 Tax=Novosphingobium sp. TaxID=1874826 RepID=UPI003BAA08DC
MHVHPPKPLHGWKEFLNEIFVIVVGVLIALGLEQVVEEWHWQHKVHDGEERLKAEAQDNFAAAIYQIIVAPCIDQSIEALEQRVLDSGERLNPAPLVPDRGEISAVGLQGSVLNTVMTTVDGSAWKSLVADGTIQHMSVQEQRRLADLYSQVSRNEVRLSNMPLGELAKPLPLDPGTRHALIADLEAVRTALHGRIVSAGYIAGDIRNLGWMPPPAQLDFMLRGVGDSQLARCQTAGRAAVDWRKVLAAQPTFEKQGL